MSDTTPPHDAPGGKVEETKPINPGSTKTPKPDNKPKAETPKPDNKPKAETPKPDNKPKAETPKPETDPLLRKEKSSKAKSGCITAAVIGGVILILLFGTLLLVNIFSKSHVVERTDPQPRPPAPVVKKAGDNVNVISQEEFERKFGINR